jgi:glycosyltransferase involved in cell wall biosynthesis
VISVVVPAHNEAAVIGRLLAALVPDGVSNGAQVTDGSDASSETLIDNGIEPLQTIVVANGCSDDTAAVAARHPRVQVVTTPEPNKHRALRLGDAAAQSFPRLYVDADVELRAEDVRELAKALEDSGVLAAAPRRHTPLDGCPWTIRWYYEIWEQLPVVREGLFGRGVIALSAEGHARIAGLPELMGDDLAASLSFGPDERRVVDSAQVIVHPPRTLSDLLRRRVRSMTVTVQAELSTDLPASRTSTGHLRTLLQERPLRNAPRIAWFAAVTAVARSRARRAVRAGDFTTWLRDESSRTAARSGEGD